MLHCLSAHDPSLFPVGRRKKNDLEFTAAGPIPYRADVRGKDKKMIYGIAVIDLLVQAGLCKSKGEARRAITQGGVRIHDVKVTNPYVRLALKDNKFILIGEEAMKESSQQSNVSINFLEKEEEQIDELFEEADNEVALHKEK